MFVAILWSVLSVFTDPASADYWVNAVVSAVCVQIEFLETCFARAYFQVNVCARSCS